ncbi:transposase [Streptomyces sp. NPDC059928]|uniref:transposase n=1 Tax=Streptomyces sp. NPDC059928 TaxID=3347007 RepID=UPI00364A3C8C
MAAPQAPEPWTRRSGKPPRSATTPLEGTHRRRATPKEEHNASHRKVRARVEHAFARMKTWKILRDCRLKGEGVHHAMLGIARLHNLTLAG